MTLEKVLAHIDADLDNATARLFELLRIQSISTDPEYVTSCKEAASWLAGDLADLGFDAGVRQTPGHPMVVGHAEGPGPHVLFYGHYDVQPVDPLSLWNNPPFDPKLEETPKGPVIRGRINLLMIKNVF